MSNGGLSLLTQRPKIIRRCPSDRQQRMSGKQQICEIQPSNGPVSVFEWSLFVAEKGKSRLFARWLSPGRDWLIWPKSRNSRDSQGQDHRIKTSWEVPVLMRS